MGMAMSEYAVCSQLDYFQEYDFVRVDLNDSSPDKFYIYRGHEVVSDLNRHPDVWSGWLDFCNAWIQKHVKDTYLSLILWRLNKVKRGRKFYPFEWKFIDEEYLSWELKDGTDRHLFVPWRDVTADAMAANEFIEIVESDYGADFLYSR